MKQTLVVLLFYCAVASVRAQTVPQTGFPPFSSIEAGSVDSVNRQNLNTHMDFPIISGPGRGLGFNFALNYDSALWEKNGTAWSYSSPKDIDLSPGWNLEQVTGRVLHQSTSTQCHPVGMSIHDYDYVYVESNGTQHAFPVDFTIGCTGGTTGTTAGYASDSSGYYLASNGTVLYQPDGTRPALTSEEDTNGNYITYVSSSWFGWIDSAGHTILKLTQSSSNNTYQYPDTTGTYQTITLALQSFNIKTNFACSGITEFTGTVTLPSSLTYPNGNVYSFTYEATPGNSGYITGRLSKITLPNGGYIQYTFGGSNDGIDCTTGNILNLSRTINDGTNSHVWQFVGSGGTGGTTTTVTAPQMPYDSAPNQSVYTFNSSGHETEEQLYQGSVSPSNLLRTVNTTWASNGTPATKTTVLEDNSTQSEVETTYDNYSNLLTLKEHDYGTGAPGPVLRTTNYTYLATTAYTNLNIMSRVTNKTIADSTGTIQYREDTAYDGNTISPCPTGVAQHDDTNYPCTFTTRGNPTLITTYTSASGPSGAETKNSYYDIFGNLVQADLDCCNSKKWTYSFATNYSYPDSDICGASGGPQLTTSYTYNAYTGQMASTTDPNNQKTSFAYDSMRRPTITTRPDSAQIVESYNDSLHTISMTNPIQGTAVNTKTIYLDGLGRSSQTSLFDASSTLYSTVQTQYDGMDRPFNVSNPFTSTAQYWTKTTFDELGRRVKILLPDSSQYTYAYSGPVITVTDPVGHQRKYQADGLNRLSITYEPDPSNGNLLTLQTGYSYTVLGHLASLTQGSQSRTFSYDGMGRLTGQILPESGTTSFQYNSFDKITQRTDSRGVITTYSYDTMNRPYQIIYNVGTTGVVATPTITYAYGANSSQYNNGRILTLTDGLGTTTNTYDNLGRITQLQHVINGTTYNIGYQYNLAGEVTSLTYPSNRIVQRSIDGIGRLTSLSSGTTTYANSFSYNSALYPTAFTFGNGVAASLGYSPDRLQLQSLSYAGGSTVFSTTYSRSQNGGNNGQVTGITDGVDSGRSITYTYDSLGRLSTAVTAGSTHYSQWGLSWTYDRYGNRLSQSVTAGTAPSNSVVVNAVNNHITTTGYSYDANGNLTNDGVNTLAYDAENRMVSSSGSSGSGTYFYAASGLRAVKVSGGTTTVYLFDGNNDIAEYTNGALANEYVYLGQRLVATHASGTLYYHVSDRQSSRVILDSGGTVLGQKGHYPFGEDWYMTALTNRHFTSYERDTESSNDNALHRFLVNRLGRFSSNDPSPGGGRSPQGFNLYTYVGNDPANKIDPSGKRGCDSGEPFYDWYDVIYDAGPFPECPIFGDGPGVDPCADGSVLESPAGESCPPPNPVPPPPSGDCHFHVLVGPDLRLVNCGRGDSGESDLSIGGIMGNALFINGAKAVATEGTGIELKEQGHTFDEFHWHAHYKVNHASKGGVITWTVSYSCNGEELKFPGPEDEPADTELRCK